MSKIFKCLICGVDYTFEDHHSCLDARCIDIRRETPPPLYRPSRRSYYREYMRKRRAEQHEATNN